MSKIALIFIAIFLFGIYSAIAMGPVYGFYLYQLIYFLNPGSRWWWADLPNLGYSFITVLTIIIIFLLRNKQDTNTLKEMPEMKWFVLILLSYGLATLIAVYPVMHNMFMIYLIKTYVIMYFAYRMLATEKKLELALLFYLIGAAYIGYEAMTIGRNIFGRVEGIGTVDAPESNGIAASIAPTIPLILYFIWHGNKKVKILAGVCAVLILNGLILINSRGAFLGLLTGFSYFLGTMLFSRYKLPKQRMIIFLIIIASITASVRLVDNTFIERMLTLQDETTIKDEGSGSRRVHFWLATFDLLEDHPLGTGIWGYQFLSPIYIRDDTMLAQRGEAKGVRAVHSTWFQALAEIGWIGFSGFIMLLFTLYRHLKRSKKILINHSLYKQYYLIVALEGSLLTFFVAGTFINMFRTEILYWLLLFAICISVITLKSEKAT